MKHKKFVPVSDCNEPLKKAMELARSDEKEYNDNNLYFYSKYFDVEKKRLNVLPRTDRNLINSYLKRMTNK